MYRNLSTNSLFSEHPELVRSLGIHQLVLQLLDTYLGIDSAARTSSDKHDAKKLKSRAKNVSFCPMYGMYILKTKILDLKQLSSYQSIWCYC